MSRFVFRLARPEDAAEVEAFNARMSAAGQPHRLSPEHAFAALRVPPGAPIALCRYLCLVDGRVRGGVSVREQMFRVRGAGDTPIAFYGYPLSEGIIDPEFGMVGLMIHKEILRRYPLIYGLGVGSLDAPVARLMTGTGWSSRPVPFHFSVLRAKPFLRNFVYLRRRGRTRLLFDLLASSGLGSAGLGLFKLAQQLRGRRPDGCGLVVEPFEAWGGWADAVWEQARDRYTFIGDRSAAALAALYPAGHPQMRKVQVRRADGRVLGWAVYSAAPVRGHNYFGDMTLGVLIDILALPEDAYTVASGVLSALAKTKADLMVVNHSAAAWNAAFTRAGILTGPTNSFLFLAPKLQTLFGPSDSFADGFYFTRGDGDGPVHLWSGKIHLPADVIPAKAGIQRSGFGFPPSRE